MLTFILALLAASHAILSIKIYMLSKDIECLKEKTDVINNSINSRKECKISGDIESALYHVVQNQFKQVGK